jgi:hypothetical protein
VGPRPARALVTREWVVPGALGVPEIGASLDAALPRPAPPTGRPRRTRTARRSNADRLPARLTVRARGPAIDSGHGARRASVASSRFFIDAGVPRWRRAGVPLVEAGRDIIWVAGVRRVAPPPSPTRPGVSSR